jgi:hypothetical protein
MRESRPAQPRKTVSRRRFLAAVSAAAFVLVGSVAAMVRTTGYVLPRGRKPWFAPLAFSTWQFVVVQHAARRITAPDRPGDPSIPVADDLDVAEFVDAWVSKMPARVRRDLGRFLAYLEHVAPLGVGLSSRFTRLGPDDQDRVLASVEASSHELLRAGFDGLKSLVFIGYYRDARTWGMLGYDGPLVGRPANGWR